ncbi:heme A: farnesyltransferase related protein [Thermoplasma acidophilum]|uniref:Protoheme IX farnesyltransferase n=1 Tax=Thermoplasma acidophilum (strain ATCC 25905 / DSM 1728 / JCM 9062 / NBRC 15155 / AMRC-C165) TaxID=273075 RepID=COXX_THEAC|nr:heme o synthase [Thermoplasma acidophilum]Q9HL05.1 RecName: Full=Protoheme IX farnesyltransferase; AltName: Full=Heme B farnesyltransferase; AltName: Full=Heme O synthase [Thermoplasma acidophilum DSM 1728]MCY0851263.1 heme o synthase [Thermoplasma acidophilum]CAC11577.1 heme A: farnesyltransferase related protein [Thermoplasma acidophilum]
MTSKAMLYFSYTKPKVWSLLVFVGAIGAVIAIPYFNLHYISLIVLATIAVMLGSMGAEATTNYIDKDIDAVMSRTMKRPLVTGQIKPINGLLFGLVLMFLSIAILAAFGKLYAALFMGIGLFDNVFIYSYLTKRRTPWNIILGGFSGGFPVVIGWYTVTSKFSILPWFLFLLVVVWIPIHVWSLAYRYRDDYNRAHVPMMTSIHNDRISAICISSAAIILFAFSIIPAFFRVMPMVYMILASAIAVPMIFYSIVFVRHPDRKNSLKLFIYSSPYLAIIFVLVLIFRFL